MEENTNNFEQPVQQQGGQPQSNISSSRMPLPNSTGILVMGIISIAVCWCYGLIGMALGIISLIMAGKANALYLQDKDKYTESSYKNMKAGKICALIGTILSGIYLIYVIIILAFFGSALTQMPWDNFNF
ncbi:MAG: CCC motif membrane protein [Bacteroidota bacterium]